MLVDVGCIDFKRTVRTEFNAQTNIKPIRHKIQPQGPDAHRYDSLSSTEHLSVGQLSDPYRNSYFEFTLIG